MARVSASQCRTANAGPTLTHPRATLRLPTIQGTSFADSVTARAGIPESLATYGLWLSLESLHRGTGKRTEPRRAWRETK